MDWDENTWLECDMSASPLSCYCAVLPSGIKRGQLFLCLQNENLPQSLIVFYVIFSTQKYVHFIKNKPPCFLAVSWGYLMYLLLAFHKFLEPNRCVLHWTGILKSVTVSSILINHNHSAFTVFVLYARHHSSLLSATFYAFTMSIFVKINFNAFGVYFTHYYWYYLEINQCVSSVRMYHKHWLYRTNKAILH